MSVLLRILAKVSLFGRLVITLSQSTLLIALSITTVTPVSAQSPKTVYVAPFVNLSQQETDVWIGIGIAETVASDLHALGRSLGDEFDVVHDVSRMAAGDAAVLLVAEELDAELAVAGAYQRVADELRITVRLLDVTTNDVLTGVTIDGSVETLFDVQDQIVDALGKTITSLRVGTELEVRLPEGIGPDNEEETVAVGGLLELQRERNRPRDATRRQIDDGSLDASDSQRVGFAAPPLRDRPRAVITRTTQPPRIDGQLDDSVWEAATHITEFTQMTPVEGAPGTEDTEVWLAYDSDNLYIAFYAHYSDPGIMRVNRAERDEIRGDDRMSVLFDPFLDQQRAYQFTVNGYGVQSDSMANADGSSGSSSSRSASMMNSRGGSSGPRRSSSGLGRTSTSGIRGDYSWDALFTTAGRLVDDGWVAEMSIPFKSLRYPARAPTDVHQWGFQITRTIREKSEAQAWSPISRAVAGQLTQFGVLEGLSNLSRSRNLEFLPELTGVQFGSLNRETGDYSDRDPDGEFGFGVKYGLTPNLTADFTYNPDFSQIESDQPQIETNQRFALFFPEQRPFFLEGQEIFQTATPLSLLHTRTIIDPRFGGKLSGKVGNTTLGVMVADDEAAGRLDDASNPQFGDTSQTFVGRARYDLYAESYLGAIMTAREFGQDHNRVGGIDGRFRLGQTHRVSFLAVGSATQNEVEGKLAGPAIEADFTRQGRNLSYSASYSSIDPDFRTDSGFLPRVDLQQAQGSLGYQWWPESTLISWGPSFTYLRLYDHAGVLQDEQIEATTSFSFQKNIRFYGNVNRDLERFSGINFRKTGYGAFTVISQRLFSVLAGYNWGDGILFNDNPFLGRSTRGNFLISARPTSRLRTELTGIFSRFAEPLDGSDVFNVKIFRTRTTYQFTERLLVRHIMEHNTQAVTVGNNILFTYRLNAGTVAFLGYDDRYQRGTRIDNILFQTTQLQRTNRAFFGKISYLFRY